MSELYSIWNLQNGVLYCVAQESPEHSTYLGSDDNALNSGSHKLAGLNQLFLAQGIVNGGGEDLGTCNQCLCSQSGGLGSSNDLILEGLVVTLGSHRAGVGDEGSCGAGNSLGHCYESFLWNTVKRQQVI